MYERRNGQIKYERWLNGSTNIENSRETLLRQKAKLKIVHNFFFLKNVLTLTSSSQ